jgi:hypothetical protein
MDRVTDPPVGNHARECRRVSGHAVNRLEPEQKSRRRQARSAGVATGGDYGIFLLCRPWPKERLGGGGNAAWPEKAGHAARSKQEVAREPRIRDVREDEVAGRQLLTVGVRSEEPRLAKGRDRVTSPGRVVPRVEAERWRGAPWLDPGQLRRNDEERWGMALEDPGGDDVIASTVEIDRDRRLARW